MVSQWVVLRTIFEACMREMGYEGGGAELGPMVAADGGGWPTEGYAKIYFVRRTGTEATGIRKEWNEGLPEGSGQ